MPYRRPAENPGLDWKKAFTGFYADRKDVPGSMIAAMEIEDSFLPDSRLKLTDADIETLLVLTSVIEALANKNHFFLFYAKLIRKVAVIVVEMYPEAFDKLSAENKEKLFGAKLDMPHEKAVFSRIYVYTQHRLPLPSMTIDNGSTLRSTLELVNRLLAGRKTANGKIAQASTELIEALCEIDSQYGLHFLDTVPL